MTIILDTRFLSPGEKQKAVTKLITNVKNANIMDNGSHGAPINQIEVASDSPTSLRKALEILMPYRHA